MKADVGDAMRMHNSKIAVVCACVVAQDVKMRLPRSSSAAFVLLSIIQVFRRCSHVLHCMSVSKTEHSFLRTPDIVVIMSVIIDAGPLVGTRSSKPVAS